MKYFSLVFCLIIIGGCESDHIANEKFQCSCNKLTLDKAIDAVAQYQSHAYTRIRLLNENDSLLINNKNIRNIKEILSINADFLENYYYGKDSLKTDVISSYIQSIENRYYNQEEEVSAQKFGIIGIEDMPDYCKESLIFNCLVYSDEAITSNAKNISLN